MGISLFCRKTKMGYYLGYGGFANLRMKIANLCCPDFGKVYTEIFTNPIKISGTPKQKKDFQDHINYVIQKCINDKKINPKVVDFCLQTDTKGKIRYGACKVIYDKINNSKSDDFIIGYAAQNNHLTWKLFIDLLKECYEHKSDLVWR